MKRIINNQKGSVLLMTLFILSSILVVALTASQIVDSGIKTGRIQSDSTKAYFAAESGTERVLWEYRKNGYVLPVNDEEVDIFGIVTLTNQATYIVNYKKDSLDVFFTGIGNYMSTKRSVQVNFQISTPSVVCEDDGGCDAGEDCSTCPLDCLCSVPGETCGGGGESGVCGAPCIPEDCSTHGYVCGIHDDGCGGTYNCASCGSGTECCPAGEVSCNEGQCYSTQNVTWSVLGRRSGAEVCASVGGACLSVVWYNGSTVSCDYSTSANSGGTATCLITTGHGAQWSTLGFFTGTQKCSEFFSTACIRAYMNGQELNCSTPRQGWSALCR
jgi:hypothetical protein